MKYLLYYRVSGSSQDYLQQKNTVDKYMATVVANEVVEIEETVSGLTKFSDRKLNSVFDIMEQGDAIVISEFSRLGRSMTNLFEFVGKCQERGVSIIQAKDNTVIPPDPNNIVSKALLFAFGLAAEIEVMNIRQRTQSALDVRKQQLKEKGSFYNKKGELCYGFGNPRYKESVYAAAEAGGLANRMKKEVDPNWQIARKSAIDMRNRGDNNQKIADTLNGIGIRTRKGGLWSRKTVADLLS